MTYYDITQEVFSCSVYPGDPAPKREVLASMAAGALYDLTAFSMCEHNGTHIDAPRHFIKDGKTVEAIGLETLVGKAYVSEQQGIVGKEDALEILKRAKAFGAEGTKAETPIEFRKAFKEALQSGKPTVIDVRIDKDEFVLPMLPPGGAIDDIITKVK